MLKVLLLDLGGTLIDAKKNVFPGVPEALTAINKFTTAAGEPLVTSLGSDFTMPDPRTPEAIKAAFAEYLSILDRCNLRRFFEPVDERVTLSTQVGVRKPARQFFEAALSRAKPGTRLEECLFITEEADKVEAARAMGMSALLFGADFNQWSDGPPLIARLVDPSSPTNLQAALAPAFLAGHDVHLTAVRPTGGDTIRGEAQAWVPLEAEELGPLKGVHVELPVKVEATLSPAGGLRQVRVAPPAPSDVAEATDNLISIRSNQQLAPAANKGTDSPVSPVLPTHEIQTDAQGRRRLVRRRFSAM